MWTPDADDFDPTLYGMAASYDDQGNYLYPEGFDPETGEWLEGYEEQRHAWEQQYAEAHARWEAHKKQVEDAERGDSATDGRLRPPTRPAPRPSVPGGADRSGRLAGFGRGAAGASREAHRRQLIRYARQSEALARSGVRGPFGMRPASVGASAAAARVRAARSRVVLRWG